MQFHVPPIMAALGETRSAFHLSICVSSTLRMLDQEKRQGLRESNVDFIMLECLLSQGEKRVGNDSRLWRMAFRWRECKCGACALIGLRLSVLSVGSFSFLASHVLD
jgi:hypothetical protein